MASLFVMEWNDIAEQEPRRSQLEAQGISDPAGMVYISSDGRTMVRAEGNAAGEFDTSRWQVWDLEREALVFPGVAFSSCASAQKAAEAWRESAVMWLADQVRGRAVRVVSALHRVAAAMAVRLG